MGKFIGWAVFVPASILASGTLFYGPGIVEKIQADGDPHYIAVGMVVATFALPAGYVNWWLRKLGLLRI